MRGASDTVLGVTVSCKSSGFAAIGANGQTGSFSIGTNELKLGAPGPSFRAVAGATFRVAWDRTPSISGVNVYLTTDGLAYQFAGNSTDNDFLDVVAPNVMSNHATIMIQATTSSNAADTTDGYFSIRSGSATVTMPFEEQAALGRGPLTIEWASPSNSDTVDVAWYDPNTGITNAVVARLPDISYYTWIVPGMDRSGARAAVTFRDSTGAVISSAQSAPFEISSAQKTVNATVGNGGFARRLDSVRLQPDDRE